MLKRIPNTQAGKILSDPIIYKKYVAESLLEQISSSIPVNRSGFDYMLLETQVESFLFFIVSVHDAVFAKMNEKLQLNLEQIDLANMYQFKRGSKMNSDIANILNHYFVQPTFRIRKITPKRAADLRTTGNSFGIMDRIVEYGGTVEGLANLHRWHPKIDKSAMSLTNGFYERYWNVENSWLWLVRKMRDEITHGRLIMSLGYNGPSIQSHSTYLLRFVHHIVNEHGKSKSSRLFWLEIENPRQFFRKVFQKTNRFIAESQKIMP